MPFLVSEKIHESHFLAPGLVAPALAAKKWTFVRIFPYSSRPKMAIAKNFLLFEQAQVFFAVVDHSWDAFGLDLLGDDLGVIV